MVSDRAIVRAELDFHARYAPKHGCLINLLAPVATLIALLNMVIVLSSAIWGFDLVDISSSLTLLLLFALPLFVLLAVTLVFYIWVWLRTLSLASQSVIREKQDDTWDTLLAERGVRRVIVGKWWAVLRTMWPQYAMLLLMRVALTIFFGIESQRFSGNIVFTTAHPYADPPQLPEVLLTIGVITLLTVFGATFTAAIGILASLLESQSARTLILSMLMGILIPLFAGMVLILPGLITSNRLSDPAKPETIHELIISDFVVYTGFSLVDAGTTFSLELIKDAEQMQLNYKTLPNGSQLVIASYEYSIYLATVVAVIGLYALLTYLTNGASHKENSAMLREN